SFTAAADKLGITKSYASKLVSRLEDRLGVRLLTRTTRKLIATEAGQAYHERCSAVLSALEDAEMAASELQAKPRGRLRMTAPAVFGTNHLFEPIVAFNKKFPDIFLEIHFFDRRVDILAEGYDVAIRAGLLHEENVSARRLATAPIFPIASPKYLARRGEPTEPEDLVNHDCLVYAYQDVLATWLLHDGKREVAVPIKAYLVANHAQMLLEAACRGLGICYLPHFHSAPYLRDGRLRRVLPEWQRPTLVPIHAVFPTTRHVPAKTRVFIDHMVDHFRIPAWST
ncbi:MAG TPA: LysR family transcriptional regulator, partial [Polyangium sp.]|nr:LysR family transcriptional regulator [Polyangium sp.]